MAITLPSGRFIEPNLDLVSVDTDGSLYEGYDGPLHDANYDYAEDWPVEDRIALANLMIDRWKVYLASQVAIQSTVNNT